jgi:hypothetical protein
MTRRDAMFLAHMRVMKGVRRLDEEIPGWAQFVKAHKLDLGHSKRCILGQLYSGHYEMGEAVLFGRDVPAWRMRDRAIRYGLYPGFLSSQEALTDEWRRVILIRQHDALGVEEACPAKAAGTVPTQ